MSFLTENFKKLIFMSVCFGFFESVLPTSNRFTFKVNEDRKERLIEGLKRYNFTKLFQITPSTLVFEYTGNGNASAVFHEIKDVFRNEIVACEPVRVHNNTLKPADRYTAEDLTTSSDSEFNPNLVCSNYYGFNVSEVWSMGITGRGVVVGINDVGINTDLADLEGNIMKNLSRNFLTGSNNVTPEEFTRYRETVQFTDHGNGIASVVAATKANNICGDGIAYNASVVALKIFNVTLERNGLFGLQPRYWTSQDIIAKALSHALNQIDISVNAWTSTEIFDPLELSIKEALQCGVNTGRYGRGTIYLVPAGPAGNEFSNNINTITVGSMGQYGSIPGSVRIDASVITVGLHKGNNITAEYMVSTSHHNKCVTSFKGVSAATAQVAGIIALALNANPNLTKRDVEHLLVHASDHTGFKETPFFSQNGAGIYFHPIFGFGLLNAYKLVKLAQEHKGIPKQLSKQVLRTNSSTHADHTQIFEFCFACHISTNTDCLTTVEHVEVTINLTTKTEYLRMELISPLDTRSVLMHQHLSAGELRKLSTFKQVKFVSVHFWDEIPFGKWKIQLQSHRDTLETRVSNVTLKLYGTSNTQRTIKGIRDCTKGSTTQMVTVNIPLLKETQSDKDNYSIQAPYVILLTLGLTAIVISISIFLLVKKCRSGAHVDRDTSSPSNIPLVCHDVQNSESKCANVSKPDCNSEISKSEGEIDLSV